VLARQHGRPIYGLTASFQVREEGFDHQDEMPEAPGPEDSFDVNAAMAAADPERREEWQREWAALDLRHAGEARVGEAATGTTKPARVRYWIKVAQGLPDDLLVHQAALAYISDMTLLGVTLVPYGMHPRSGGVQAASLDHTIWFHRPFRADDWLLYDQQSPSASGARGLALGRLFTEDGRLVASVAQEGLIRPRPERAGDQG
jgi:acyl-CoA thioesterase-2